MKDVRATPKPTPTLEELENYRRLVELQSQIVELARCNDEAERRCEVLRQRLEQQNARRCRGKSQQMLARLLERLRQSQAVSKLSMPSTWFQPVESPIVNRKS